jgi:hypothetical protein
MTKKMAVKILGGKNMLGKYEQVDCLFQTPRGRQTAVKNWLTQYLVNIRLVVVINIIIFAKH